MNSIFRSSIINLACPVNLSYWWNFGSCLGLLLGVQVRTGLILSFHYCPDVFFAFDSVSHIMRDVQAGWFFRLTHANGASIFFLAIYFHIGRGIYFASFTNVATWWVGVLILLSSMAAAFLGYTLPWGQISFWGATVITNLLRALPYFGTTLVHWVWGGFSVDNATLARFFSLHFLLPFVVSALAGLHIFYLHTTGSNNPLGLASCADKVPFHSFYSFKDVFGFSILISVLLFLVFFFPYLFFVADNFMPANMLVTPSHIIPEWYFLFAYAILRCIYSKLGGVLALFSSIVILLFLSYSHSQSIKGLTYYGFIKAFFWVFVTVFVLLTVAGS